MKRAYSFLCILLIFALLPYAATALVSDQKPLLMPGKRALYQRVLAGPGSEILAEPKTGATGKKATPFMIYHVYARRDAEGEEWVQVGSDSHGTLLGWIRARQVIPWHQALTVTFKRQSDKERVLLFRDRDSLKQLVDKYDLATYDKLYEQAARGEIGVDSPVAAIQPKQMLDIHKSFYLVPIKRHEDVFLGPEKARMLEVASVSSNRVSDSLPTHNAEQAKTFKSGIVFVIDTTQSMRPYIDKTREVMRKVYDTIDAAGVRDKVSFGLTAFRDDVGVAPQIEYLTREFVNLKDGVDADTFFRKVDEVSASQVSNKGFREDSYAGVKAALESNDWTEYDGRTIILVTDASSRFADDALSSTHMDAKALQQLAQEKGVAIWIMHLRTPRGEFDHATAKAQYKELSKYPGIGDFYYGVKFGAVNDFGRALESLAQQITRQVQATSQGVAPGAVVDDKKADDSLAAMQEKVAKLGYALQMRYLQKSASGPPPVFDAWLVDRDFHDPRKSSIDVRVLVTRDQLSDLRSALQQVLQLAEEGVLSPQSFLNELKSMAATLSRNTGEPVKKDAGDNLADLGYMQEYMEDLPYTSEVMSLSLSDWQDWSPKQQLEFVHRLENKVSYYQALHDHTDQWVSPEGGPVTGDSIHPIPLDMLP